MKKMILTVAAVLLGVSLFAYDIAAAAELKGGVKSVTRTDFAIVSKFGEYFRTPGAKTLYKFNGAGQVVESSELNSRDGLVNKIINTYDADGNLTAETCFDSDNVQIWNTVITYKNGKKADSSEYAKGGVLKGRTIYSYTGNNLTDESYYDGDGAIMWKNVSKYNSANQLETVDGYFADGSLDNEMQYAYTPAGKIDSISYFDGKGALTSKEVFRYDDKSTLTEVTEYNVDNKVVCRTLAKYDAKGNLAKITVYNVARKFGTTVNEMVDMSEFAYEY